MADLEQFAELCQRLTGTTKKLEKRAWMAEFLRELPVHEAGIAALYFAGTPFSETDRRDLNVGGASVSRVLKELASADDAAMHAAYLRRGDLGAAAFDLLAAKEPVAPSLTLGDVESAFNQLAEARGVAPKQQQLKALLAKATPLEAKYLIKLMVGDMRTGVKAAQAEEAIAVAYGRELTAVRRATMLLGDLREVVALAHADGLSNARMRLFHPLGFMLASPVDTVEEAVERFAEEVEAEKKGKGGAKLELGSGEERAASERHEVERLELASAERRLVEAHVQDKYDGIRCQVHCGDPGQPGRVALFSRSRDDMTHSFPEIVEAFGQVKRPLILDGEILAWSPAEERALPFSSLQGRIGRKRVTAEMRQATPVVFMAFDLMYADDALLLEEPLSARRARLEQVAAEEAESTRVGSEPAVAKGPGTAQERFFEDVSNDTASVTNMSFPRLVLAPVAQLHSAEQLDEAYADARARGNEGVMLKSAASLYQPGRRGLAWLKLKRTLPTLDVVVTSAEYGNGRRAGILSDFTFAVRDGDSLKNVGKAYSGLTDAEINGLSTYFHEHTLNNYGAWRTVEPTVVLEVAFNNLMRSDRHASGFAMRFPRIVRIRDDKPVGEIDTLARVEEIYNEQPDKPVEGGLAVQADAPAAPATAGID